MTDKYCIRTEAQLAEIYGPPHKDVVKAVLNELHEYHIAYLQQARFVCIGSGRDNDFDASPRGGEAGFVHIIDKKTIALPDWRGNNKIETIRNIVATGRVGLLFLFPGLNIFLRINGAAEVTREPRLLQAMARKEGQPFTAIRVAVKQVYLHCGKAVQRAHLWKQDNHLNPKSLPSIGTMVREFTRSPDIIPEELEKAYSKSLRDELY